MGALVTRQGNDETNAVINVKRDFHRQAGFNVYSTIKDKDQRSERAYGGGAWYGNGSWIGAARLVIDEAPGKYAQAGAIVADYSVPNFFSTLQGMWVEPDFDPPHAFFDFNDKRGFYSYTEYDREHRSGPIRRESTARCLWERGRRGRRRGDRWRRRLSAFLDRPRRR